ncbi:MAG: SusC/RagA family TonB-linked outer membrane protein, partial [Prevotellaceae bacterium]|nr:SusC/RagA family TonB-linked outer membrane protein [Prevotellaceae bacterium]
MKITTLLLFVSTSLYAAHTAAQEAIVNVAATTQTLEALISRIEEQTNYMVVYNSTELNTKQEVTVEHTEGKVKDVLDEALTNTDVAYLFDNDYIILRKENSDPTVTAVAQQPRGNSVSGIILDATTGDPLIGANIMEKGTTNGVISNVDGRFTLNVQRGAVLVVSYVGFTSQEVTVGNQTNITIRLTEDSDVLDEVVVVGYGTQKRVTVTGSLATTRGDELSQVPTASVTNTLSGRLPGLVAYTRSGEPGADDAGLLIRGISTTGNSDPLIVVDGVAARDGGFSRIDPNDIESITILKDASAAIYGSRAANGVILVTTKRGKAEKVRVSYTGNVGMSYPTVLPKMASSAEYAILYNELVPGTYSDEAIQKYRDGSDPLNYPNVSALDELIRPGLQTRHNVSISGGSNIVQFFASLGYQYQDNYYKNSASNNNQYNFRSNLDITPVKDLKISLDISFREQDRNSPVYNSTDIWRYLIKHRPYTNIFFPGTNYGNAESLQDNFSPATGLDNTMGYQHNRNAYINSGLSVHWDLPWITQGLSVDGAGYFDRSNTFYKSWQHKYYLYNYVDGDYVSRELGSNVLSENMNRNTGITLNARVNYERTFAEVHNVKAFAAYEQFTYRNDYLQARRQDFVSTAVDELFAG